MNTLSIADTKALLKGYVSATRVANGYRRRKDWDTLSPEERQEFLAVKDLLVRTFTDLIAPVFDAKYRYWRGRVYARLIHIAYCLQKGRTYEQIEQPKYRILSDSDWEVIQALQNVITKPEPRSLDEAA